MRTTCLSAHALPPEYAGRADAYIDAVCAWLPALHREGLVDAVDGFCDRIGFTAAQTRRVFEAARRLGLPVKLHAEQLSDQHGAVLAAEYGALSCDHLEYAGADGVAAMAAAGTVAVLLPGAFYFLRETRLPPVAALRAAGVPIAIATDHNPGSSPTLSPLLMLSMACTLFRLTPEEALRGMTVDRGARARPRRSRHARRRAARRLRRLGRRASERARVLVRQQPVRARRRRRRRADGVSEPVFTLHRGSVPLLLSLPHVGTEIPDDLRPRLRAARAGARGHRLAPRRGLRLRARARRERPRAAVLALRDRPEPARPRTRRCTPAPTTPSSCRRASSPAIRSIATAAFRTSARSNAGATTYWRPYHDAIAGELDRLVAAHGHAIVWDGHSIQAEVPWLFEGRLPDLNLGTAAGASCAPALRDALSAVLAAQSSFSHVTDGRFKGGYITRRYGRPRDRVHAIQLEMGLSTYMDETRAALPVAPVDRDRLARLQPVLRELLRDDARLARRCRLTRRLPCSGRRSPGCRRAGASASCCAPAPTAAGPRSRPTSLQRRKARRWSPDPCCPASSTRTATPSSARSPA